MATRERDIPVEGVGSHALSDNSKDHGELIGNETLTPQVIFWVEHVTVLESGESDAVQVEAPDDHLGVVWGGRVEMKGMVRGGRGVGC